MRPGRKCESIPLICQYWTPGEDKGKWDELGEVKRGTAGGREARAGCACRGNARGAGGIYSFGEAEAGVWVLGMQGQAEHRHRALPR